MTLSPSKLGCTPSRSIEVEKPVLQSAMTMGESVVLSPFAQAGIAALMAWMFELENDKGMTKSTWCHSVSGAVPGELLHGALTMIFILGLAARMMFTIFVYAAIISVVVWPRVTSLVPSMNMTMSAGVFCSQLVK